MGWIIIVPVLFSRNTSKKAIHTGISMLNGHKTFFTRYLAVFMLSVLVSAGTAGCVIQQNPVSGSQRVYGYSWQQELEMGAEADKQLSEHFGIYDDEQLAGYVERVGKAVLAESHMRRDDTPERFREASFEFRVLDSPVVNAFALPGGYNYVTRDMLAHVENEAQLAMVLGHEIAHVAARHASQQAFRQQLGQVLLGGGALIGEVFFDVSAQHVLELGGAASQLLFLSYSRGNEREADQLGVEYAARAGYRAEEGAGFFQTLERMTERAGGGLPTYLSSHPDPGERQQRIREVAEEWRAQGYEMDTRQRRAFLEQIDGMVFGEDPRQGFMEQDTFYHPAERLLFSVPADWEMIRQQHRTAFVEPDERAVTMFQALPEAAGAREAMAEFSGQEGVTVIREESLSINGLPARRLIAETESDGQRYRYDLVAISYRDQVYRLVSMSLAREYGRWEPAFTDIAESFQELQDPEVLGIEPARIRIRETGRTAPFSDFLPEELPMDMEPEQVAILNQVDLDEEIRQGRMIKIPVQQ